ncbi:LysR family transcriptional regulator, partial [Rhizobium ruizarguesonis]
MPLDWDKLRIFHAAAEAGSFTHAADKLHLSQSAISRQVSALEQADRAVGMTHVHIHFLVVEDQLDLQIGIELQEFMDLVGQPALAE